MMGSELLVSTNMAVSERALFLEVPVMRIVVL